MVIICLRDPDASNEFLVFGGQAQIVDVDYGRRDLRDPDEFDEWRNCHLETVKDLYAAGEHEAGLALANLIAEAIVNYDHIAPQGERE